MSAIVQAESVSKSYTLQGERLDVLRDVSFELYPGMLTALVGRSGSGKSTLLLTLGALKSPDAGTVRIDGIELAGLGGDEAAKIRREKIGFVFQSFNLLPHLSAWQNVALPYPGRTRLGASLARKLLIRMGLGDRAHHRPDELSAGEQQRVALARALVNDPSVLLADEPTGNLDAETEGILLGLLDDTAREGRAVLMVTHSTAVAARAQRVFRMAEGRITQIGTDR